VTPSPETPSPARRARWLDPRYLAVAFGLVFAWSEVSQAWRGWGPAGLIYTYTGFIPLQLYSAWSLQRAARRADLSRRTRQALNALAGAFLCYAIGSTLLAVIAVGANDEPRYTVADLFFLLAYPLQISALLLLPRVPGSPTRRSRQVLDVGALLLVSAVLVYTHWTLRADWGGLGQFLATVYPILGLAGLLAANIAMGRGLPVPSARAWRLLVGSQAASLLTDVMFQTLWATGYEGPNWSLPVFVAVNLATLWAAHWYATDPMASLADRRAPLLQFSPLPILLATGGAGVLLLLALSGQTAVVRPVLVTLILLNVLLVAREFLLVMDATHAARLESAQEGERRFEALVRGSTDLILVVDAGHTIRFSSPASWALLGRTAEQMSGLPLGNLAHPEEQAGLLAVLDRLLLRPGDTATVATRLLHTDGEWRRFESKVANLTDDPAVRGVVFNARDVTERTLLEEQLRQAQKMEVVGHLAGGVAHDFNNLLTTVLAGSEFALQDLPPGHTLREDMENIRVAAQRGAALTSRLLAFSRPRGADPQVVRIGVRVAGAQPLIQRLVGDAHTLALRINPASGAARVDPDDLEHALLNLAANSRDAMTEGGLITFTVEDRVLERPLESRFLPAPAGAYVVVEVADTGTGIELADQGHLFQPFFTTKPSERGTGLGLAGVAAFMRRSSGGIRVESVPGVGSRFQLWFPRLDPVGEQGTEPESVALARGSGTLLLVEDDDVVRHTTRRILVTGGYTVLEASNAEEARAVFDANDARIDLLVTDVMMPRESGAALAAALRQRRPGLPVLYISGYPGEDLARLGLLVGEVELLRKPFTIRELIDRVHTVLTG